MCGIAGVLDWSNQNTVEYSKNILENMGSSMAHRGPDDYGFYQNKENTIGLVHRRLSILELSKLGHQPMVNGRYAMVYNGEVYNFQDIKSELQKAGVNFLSNSDSEVVLQAFIKYGNDCFRLFNGMFAIAIWDDFKKELTMARDRIGIKPLYYFIQNQTMVFASEMKSIFAHPKFRKTPNEEAIYNYLIFGHQLDNQTWFKGLMSLDPGCFMIMSKNDIKQFTFWKPIVKVDYGRSYSSFKDELRASVIEAVNLHQISDVPVGAHLSGGVDSSTIVSIASGQFNSSLHTFSSTFEGLGNQYDETDEILSVQKRFGTTHHVIKTDADQLESLIPKLIYQADEPIVGPAMIPMYFVNKAVRDNGIIVVNGGHGVDEMFGGYPPSFTHVAYSLLEMAKKGNLIPSELIRIPEYLKKGGAFKRYLSSEKLIENDWLNHSRERDNAFDRHRLILNEYKVGNTTFDANMLMMIKHYLPGLLHQEDRMSMISSIESRVPFLDNRLIDLALSIPFYYKVRNGNLKYIFRDSMKSIVPDKVLKNKIKRGYPTPISIWAKKELYSYIKSNFENKNVLSGDIIKPKEILNMLDKHRSGLDDFGNTLWSCLAMETWFKTNFS